ncbi:zinc-ribbon domain-containing protein [Puniceibacterium confluentis]|uniref:zinc-ribbon domain-containing protein n=1 Tax=Puniceibacterium confluentis TaxID=1958944 RepID=UPI0011B41907|nr:zinc-ribbon domain-containing protein [Puniceibacterium confluentis]
MRLICPNCGAQYEVPVEVIPAGGRDVQCSNCGNTWYQNHPDDDPVLSEELALPVPDEDWSPDTEETPQAPVTQPRVGQPHTAPEAGKTTIPAPSAATAARPRPPVHSEYDDDGDNAPAPALPPRDVASVAEARARSLDPSVAEVLREEAARESRQRAAEFSSLESQPDLGLENPAGEQEPARRARESRERMERMRGVSPSDAAEAQTEHAEPKSAAATKASAAAANSRRDLLPDVEEINQTLRSTRERREVETPQGRALMDEPNNGFGRGFMLMVLLAVILAAIYILAPQITSALPAAEPYLTAYVTWVDQLRLWLDVQVTSMLLALDGLSSEATTPPAN